MYFKKELRGLYTQQYYYRYGSRQCPHHTNKDPDHDIISFDNRSERADKKEKEEVIYARIVNQRLAKISIAILLSTIAGFIISEFIHFAFHVSNNFSLSIIAMLGATVLYALSKERNEILLCRLFDTYIFCCNVCVYFGVMVFWSNTFDYVIFS
jgi:hypothetical protein